MFLHKVTVYINGQKSYFITMDLCAFLYEIDAQPGKLEDSGMEHLMKDKIEIEEDEGEFWWSPKPADEVKTIMDEFRKNRK